MREERRDKNSLGSSEGGRELGGRRAAGGEFNKR